MARALGEDLYEAEGRGPWQRRDGFLVPFLKIPTRSPTQINERRLALDDIPPASCCVRMPMPETKSSCGFDHRYAASWILSFDIVSPHKSLFRHENLPSWAVAPYAVVVRLFRYSDHAPPRPNIVFILMMMPGHGDFGLLRQQKIETPNIDSLSARGIRFTQMYTSAPLSSPARCGLFDGDQGPRRHPRQRRDGVAR